MGLTASNGLVVDLRSLATGSFLIEHKFTRTALI
jgi:hypothetical protein